MYIYYHSATSDSVGNITASFYCQQSHLAS